LSAVTRGAVIGEPARSAAGDTLRARVAVLLFDCCKLDPANLVARVSARMAENPRAKDCLRWARDVQTDLTRRLHAAGLLS
jgi:hypothetical protein